jgi:hypothetical protein
MAHMRVVGAGQAVVQFARGIDDGRDYAVKFFLREAAFQVETVLYAAWCPSFQQEFGVRGGKSGSQEASGHGGTGSLRGMRVAPDVAKFLPQVEAVCEQGQADLKDPDGAPLPPCIVMERGESLQEWADRADPDRFTALAVRR